MGDNHPLVALISATPAAVPPAVGAFRQGFPAARVWNILDDRLLVDADQQGGVTPALSARMRRLIDHAVAEGADGILLTCSLFGFVAHEVDVGVPIYAPDDAAFDEVIGVGYRRLLIVASLQKPLDDVLGRFGQAATDAGRAVEVQGVVAEGAYNAALAGDEPALLASLTEACKPYGSSVDAVLLAQYSLSPVATSLAEALGLAVLSGPLSAAQELRSRLSGRAD